MKPTSPTAEIVVASKPLIAELRAMDTHNRNRKEAHVEYLRQEIREGRFCLTNQGVGVTVSGYIADGGHRLEAIWLEGCPAVSFVLVRNLPDICQKYIDRGSQRSMADTLTLFFDAAMTTKTVAILNVLWYRKKKRAASKPSPDDLIELFSEFGASLKRLVSMEHSKTIPAPVVAVFMASLHETSDERVMKFAHQVITGELLQLGDPALTLKNWLQNSRRSVRGSGGGSFQIERFKKATSAVEAFLEDRRLVKLYA